MRGLMKYPVVMNVACRAALLGVFMMGPVNARSADTEDAFAKGYELMQAGKWQDAAREFERGLKAEPRNAMGHYYLGETYANLQETDKAKAHLLEALVLGPRKDIAEAARNRFVDLARSASAGIPSGPAPQSVQGPRAGARFRDCGKCPEMVVVPAGEFKMGSPDSEPDRYDNEGPQHSVRLEKAIAVGRFEVTFDEWGACVAARACSESSDVGWGRGKRPVINVNHRQATAYATWLTSSTGKNYRLLSEAEWEYSARAGAEGPHNWKGSAKQACAHANVSDRRVRAKHKSREIFDCDDGFAETAPVGHYKANALGLHDMLGNVWEWVADCDNAGYAGAPADGSAWMTGDCSRRMFRGGSWYSNPGEVRLAQRDSDLETASFSDLGFRVARTLP
jgi:formylglycine-generating enzyme required for sulfatase activity